MILLDRVSSYRHCIIVHRIILFFPVLVCDFVCVTVEESKVYQKSGVDTSREEKKTTSQEMMDMVVPGKRRRGGLDGDGSTTPGKI